MADLVFSKKSGILKGLGGRWKGRSGIRGKFAPLKSREYTVPPRSLMVGTERVTGVDYNSKYGRAPYKDRRGFGWFLWLGTGNLGIHPDGNVPGTKGCIGVINSDTRPLFEKLRRKNPFGLTVQVTD